MAHVQLISSDREKVERLLAELHDAGHRAAGGKMSESLRRGLLDLPPQAIINDLDRAPATGRDLGLFFRVQAATRRCLLVYLDGKPADVQAVQTLLPDACFTAADELTAALEAGLRNPPATPIVPESVFAGYRGRPLSAKLGLKAGMSVALLDAPGGIEEKLAPLPAGLALSHSMEGTPDVTLWFTNGSAELEAGLSEHLQFAGDGKLWIAWPKRSSGVECDLTQASVRQAGLGAGWVDFKICSIDDTWSALCFTRRKE